MNITVLSNTFDPLKVGLFCTSTRIELLPGGKKPCSEQAWMMLVDVEAASTSKQTFNVMIYLLIWIGISSASRDRLNRVSWIGELLEGYALAYFSEIAL